MSELTLEQKKYKQMTEDPIAGVIVRLALPTIVTMLVTSVYNMADTYFVSHLSRSASGAVGVVLSLMTIIQAVGFTLGMGSGNMIARALGQHDENTAREYAMTGFVTSFAFGVIIMIIGLAAPQRLARLLGSTETILPYAVDYMRYILIGAPYMAAAFTLNGQLRFQGNSFFSMLGIGFGGILNMGLDPLLIYVFDMGIAGAAIATIVSQFISFMILLYFSVSRRALVPLRFSSFRPTRKIYLNIMRMGLPTLFRQGIASISTIVLNHCALPYGDAAIAAMGIVNRITTFLFSALLGFGQGYQPLCAYCYSAGKYSRIRQGFYFCVKVACTALIGVSAVVFLFSGEFIEIFRRGDAEVIAIGTAALRMQCVMLPFIGFSVMNNMLTQTMGLSGRATLLACARQGIFFLPAILILSSVLGLTGVEIAQPVADFFTFLMAIYFNSVTLRELPQKDSASS